jgi:[ribosomal protein S5]-alanine N-acetyltransferase
MTARKATKRVKGLARALAVGEHVFLLKPTASDAEEFLAMRRASRKFLEQWEPVPMTGIDPFGRAAFDLLLRLNRRGQSLKMMVCRLEDGRIVGQVSLNMIIRGAFQSCFLGYWIGQEFARKGYTTEAVRLATGYAFDTLGLHRVEANIIPRNKASIGLIRKCGFRFEGLAKNYLQIAGRWQDHEHWTMTREMWDRRGGGRPRRKRESQTAKKPNSR